MAVGRIPLYKLIHPLFSYSKSNLWKFGDYKHYTSLKLLANVLGIPSPKENMDGSLVRKVYCKDKNLNLVVHYCERYIVF